MMRDVFFFKKERSFACIVVYCASTILPINEFCKMKLFQKRIHNTHTKQPPMQNTSPSVQVSNTVSQQKHLSTESVKYVTKCGRKEV